MEIKGLTNIDVHTRMQNGQSNIARQKVAKSTLRIVFDNWFTLFNLFNAIIALALALVGAWLNMAFLLIIILNASIGTVQEIRAKRLVKNLSLINSPKARVFREGGEIEIAIEDIVLDDIIVLAAGDQVPADAVVLEGLAEVNESLLTGESAAINKAVGGELLSGSYLTGGKCLARVARVGADSFAARIASEAKRHKRPSSELLRSMARVTYFTSFILVPVGILLFCVTYFGPPALSLKDAVITSSAAVLGMLPKGLVLISTIALFTGVIKLSNKHTLVQDLHAIETLARVDVLCLDKTGTLTTGNMQVTDVIVADQSLLDRRLLEYFSSESSDSNATIEAIKKHFFADTRTAPAPAVLARVPFSSDRRFSGLSFEGVGSVVLAAPELLSPTLPQKVRQSQEQGSRVLCAAFSPDILADKLPANAVIFAYIILADPVRETAKTTLDYFRREGVTIKIISGDNPLTVSLIAKQAGLAEYENYVDMSKIEDKDIAHAAIKYSVFGRTSPNQKKAIVEALKAASHVVAMTGDGVNDLPALRAADCGIALSGGNNASRQAAELVLVENDFSALPEIVVEGRRVMNNVLRVSGVFFIKTIYSALLSFFCIAARVPFPFIPIQVTLIDAAIEAYPSFFLSFEPDKARVENRFIPTALSRALPYAIAITMSCFLVNIAASLAGLSELESVTVMYYLTGYFTVFALFRSCLPLNKFRMFLCVTSCGGFFVATLIFGSLLSLAPLSVPLLLMFAAFAAGGTALLFPLIQLVNKLFKKQ